MKKRRSLLAVFIVVIFFAVMLAGCGENAKTSEKQSENSGEYMSILTDKKFRRGFKVRGLGLPIYPEHAEEETFGPPSALYDTDCVFQYGKEDLDNPLWAICQWSSRYAFHDPSITSFNANGTQYTYENKSKLLSVDTSTGRFTLGLKGEECYVYGDRQPLQEWPHLLISRDINRSELTKISDKKEIRVRLDARLDLYEDKMRIEAGEYMHAAQCMFYLYVSNYDEVTDNFTDMLWLGMWVFDNRYEYAPEFAKGDVGSKESETGKYIYNVAGDKYLSATNNFYTKGKISVGNEVSIDFNILPYVKIALDRAQADGYMEGSKYENLYINGMYVGFELPGTYNIRMTFENMDIKVL